MSRERQDNYIGFCAVRRRNRLPIVAIEVTLGAFNTGVVVTMIPSLKRHSNWQSSCRNSGGSAEPASWNFLAILLPLPKGSTVLIPVLLSLLDKRQKEFNHIGLQRACQHGFGLLCKHLRRKKTKASGTPFSRPELDFEFKGACANLVYINQFSKSRRPNSFQSIIEQQKSKSLFSRGTLTAA